jgi:hypothetical protein
MPFKWWLGKENVVYTQNGVEWNYVICKKMDETVYQFQKEKGYMFFLICEI